MTASSTPEQSARAILGIFKFRNCYAGDPLEIGYVKNQFLENHGSARDCDAGLMYAEDNGWLEVTPTTRDMQPRDMLTLTAAGFAQI
jgi:hypothetical protein